MRLILLAMTSENWLNANEKKYHLSILYIYKISFKLS